MSVSALCALLLLSASDTAAERAGEIIGTGVVIVVFLGGALKCAQIARRPSTSALCSYGLMLVLLGWLSFSVIPSLEGLGVAGSPLVVLLSILGLLSFGAGAVLAVAGLVDYRRHPEYVQGRKQAAWAIAVVSLMCASIVVGGVLGVMETIEADRQAATTEEAPFGTHRSEALGLVVDLDGTGWRKWGRALERSPGAEVGGLHDDSAGFLITPLVFGEKPPHLDALTRAALAGFGADYPSPDFTDLEPVTQAGLTGRGFRYHRRGDDASFDYRMRVLVGEGRGLFVSVWVVDGRGDLEARAREVFSAVRLPGVPEGLTLEGLPESQRLAQARLHNDIGRFHHEARDYVTSLDGFMAAVRADPSDRTYLVNVLQAFGDQSAWDGGLAYLEGLDHPLRRDDEVRSWEAWFAWHAGNNQAALDIYDDLFTRGFRGDEDLKAYGALLADAERHDDLRRVFDRYLAEKASVALRLEQARLLGSAGRHREAIEVLETEQQRMPFSADITWELLKHHEALDQHRQRLALCEALIEHDLASADLFWVKGDAEVALKWYRLAKASFEEGLKHRSSDPDLLDYLQYVSALLGEGNNTEIKQAIEPVPLPGILDKQMRRVLSPPAEGFGAHYLYWVEGIAFQRGQRALTTTRQRIQVDDLSGVERFSTLNIELAPLSERLYVNELAVRDEAGKVLSRGRAADYYLVDSQEYEGATHDKILHIPVPGLQPGRVIDLTYTRLERGSPTELAFRAIPLGGSRPVGLRAVYFLGDPEELRHRSANGLSAEAIPGGVMWSVEQPPVFPREPMQVDATTVVPTLWLGDAAATWDRLTEGYLARIEDRLVTAEAVSTKARHLVEKVDDPADRVDAVMRHVQRGYVYKPIEFGRRAQVPNSAEMTMRLGYGDCKDHALLLKQLLQAISVPTQLVLVNTSSPIQQEIPSLDQFNHVIVRVAPGPAENGRFFDPTDKGLSLEVTPPLALANRLALVLDPSGARFERLPAYGADSSTLSVDRQVRITSEGRLSIEEEVELHGYYAAWLRDYLSSLEPARHREWAQRVLAATERAATLRTLTTSQVEDPDKPLVLRLTYDLPQHCREDSDGVRCHLPAPWEVRYLEVEPVVDRRTPFEIRYPLRVRATTTVHSPGPGTVESGPDASGGQAELATWSLRAARGGPSATFEFECAQPQGRHAARRYAAYTEAVSHALRSASREVVWRPSPSTASR